MNLPNHLAIIMDGNYRWAIKENLSKDEGHRKGAENAFRILKKVSDLGIKNLSLYAFSSENWDRPDDEVNSLMRLLAEFTQNEINKVVDLNVKLKFVGRLSRLSDEVRKVLEEAEDATELNDGINLNILVSYGSRQEIVDSVKKIILKEIKENEINNDTISKNLYIKDMPDVDLLIRTGDKYRISNFLLWQSAYAELYFSKKMWPDFTESDLEEALKDFDNRNRSFGLRDE